MLTLNKSKNLNTNSSNKFPLTNKNKKIECFVLIFLITLIAKLKFSSCLKEEKQNSEKNDVNLTDLNYEFIPCGKSKCIVSQGYCKEKTNSGKKENNRECVCFEDYGSIKNPYSYECNYQKKSQLKAFLLELILSNGAGHFYLENYYFAITKLLVWVFTYYFFIILRITCKSAEDNKKISFLITASALFFCLGMLSWQIVDVVFFGLNKYTDGNGVELRSWASPGENS